MSLICSSFKSKWLFSLHAQKWPKSDNLSFLRISRFEKLFTVSLYISYTSEMDKKNSEWVSKNSNSLLSFSLIFLSAKLELCIEKAVSSLDFKVMRITRVGWRGKRIGKKDLIKESLDLKQSRQTHSFIGSFIHSSINSTARNMMVEWGLQIKYIKSCSQEGRKDRRKKKMKTDSRQIGTIIGQ